MMKPSKTAFIITYRYRNDINWKEWAERYSNLAEAHTMFQKMQNSYQSITNLEVWEATVVYTGESATLYRNVIETYTKS